LRRGALAARASSYVSDGSGASSTRRSRLALLSLAALLFATLLIVASASASKEVFNYFGGEGSLGGQFKTPGDSAVNNTGAGPANVGDIYVADENNNRVQRFDSLGNFISAWGADVIQSGKPGDIAGTNPFEICITAANCKAGVAAGGNGEVSGDGALNKPQSVAVDSDTGNVFVSDRNNRRIDEYDGEGKFIASFGFDVDATTAPTTYEVCPAGDVCKAGVAGSGVGQYGSGSEERTFGIAVSPPNGEAAVGKVYLADSGNRRVDTYGLDGTSPSSFGSSANFGFGSGANLAQPRKVAVDSRGIVYASNSKGGGEIERYDSQNANGGGVGFLAPIGASRNEVQNVTFTGFNQSDQFTLTCPDGSSSGPTNYEGTVSGFGFIESRLNHQCGAEEERYRVTANPPYTTFRVEFQGSFGSIDEPTMTCTRLTGVGSCSVTTEVNGSVGTLLNAGTFPQFSTRGLAVHPDSDGAGPDSDVLYVLRRLSPGNDVVQQLGPVNKPGLGTAPTVADDTHGAGANFETGGLGLNDANGQLLVSFAEVRVAILADAASIPAPGITIDPVSAVGESTATFSGTVDPKGGLVSCKFQYSTDQVGWTDLAEPDCASLATSGGAQAVSQSAAGLDPNTHYYVRLAVSRPFIPGSTVLSAITRTFETTAVPPVVSDVGAIQIQDTSMRLVATIDPRHSPTGYVFEYGTTPALGSSTAPLDIGGGNKPITVSRVIGALSPDTTYYFRLVATNQIGTTTGSGHSAHTRSVSFPPGSPGNCSNAALRKEQSTTFLPDCRAYEMVSPTDKNQGGLDEHYLAISRDGNAAAYLAPALFGEPAGQQGFLAAPYLSRRGPEGWSTANPFPHYCPIDSSSGGQASQGVFLSPSLDQALIRNPESAGCAIPPLDPAAPLAPGGITNNLYREDLTASPAAYDLLAPRLGSGSNSALVYGGGSDDFSHIVYLSQTNQTDPPDSPATASKFTRLYEWEEEGQGACAQPGGCLALLSKDPAGNPFTTESSVPGETTRRGFGANAVSSNGERIYFQNQGAPDGGCGNTVACRLYMREGGTTTYKVSTSECTASCGVDSSPASLVWANPSGDVAFFLSCDKLTDQSAPPSGSGSCNRSEVSAGAKLYRWDLNSPPGHRLTDLGADHELADGAQPQALDMIGASDDGNTVFFVAGGQIVSGAPTNPGLKLYRWRWNGGSPTVDYLAPYVSYTVHGREFTESTFFGDSNMSRQHVRVTPDGKYLVVLTALRLDAAADHDSDTDLYRWDEAEGWRCVSCQAPGALSAGNVDYWETATVTDPFNSGLHALQPVYSISDDGRKVFFETPDALVPEDVNGEAGCPVRTPKEIFSGGVIYACQDVYEWNDGTLSLISSGSDPEGAVLVGATHTGEDVFFLTRKRLVGWDADNGRDLYDARVGGGFPEPAPLPPPCEGEGCPGPGSSAPGGAEGAGTAVFQGPGNPTPKHHKARKHHKKRHHKSGRANHKRRAGR